MNNQNQKTIQSQKSIEDKCNNSISITNKCKVCGDLIEYIDINGKLYIQKCANCENIKRSENAMLKTGVNELYLNKRFDNYILYKEKEIKDQQINIINYFKSLIKNWNEKNYETLILLLGGCGTGKGHLTTAFIYELIKKYKHTDCKFIKSILYFNKIKSYYGIKEKNKNDNEDVFKKQYLECDLLVLDEIGMKTRESEWFFEELYMLIDTRLENGKVTILTSNMDINELDKLLLQSPKLKDRVLSTDNKFIGFNWQSYRQNKGGQ
jgi:DNA replication protein DnaC